MFEKEYIDLEETVTTLKRNSLKCFNSYYKGYVNAIEDLADIPTADVAPVVRCKDCKYFNHKELECRCDGIVQDLADSGSFRLNFYLDDYCSYGVRKENDIWLKKNT